MFMHLNDPFILSAFCYGKLEMYAFLRRKEVMKASSLLVSTTYKHFCLLYNIVKYLELFTKLWEYHFQNNTTSADIYNHIIFTDPFLDLSKPTFPCWSYCRQCKSTPSDQQSASFYRKQQKQVDCVDPVGISARKSCTQKFCFRLCLLCT